MERTKMPRAMRAKQFAPFDALKGLQDALRLKEYQHEKILKGDMTEEKASELSDVLVNMKKGDVVKVTYFEDEHEKKIEGVIKLLIDEQAIQIEKKKISLDQVIDIELK